MIAGLLLLLPLLAAVALAWPALRAGATTLLVVVATIEAALAVLAVATPPSTATLLGGQLRLDATSRLFLAVVDPIFLGIAAYVAHRVRAVPVLRQGVVRFTCLALVFLACVNAVLVSNDLMVMWIALEVSTLAVAPLIVRPGAPASWRASWHYALFSSVGLGLVLLGLLSLLRGMPVEAEGATLVLDRLLASANHGTGPFTQIGLALVLLGIGTKLGLAPMYTWLPEVYDEAPPAVTALLGAVQFNAAFVLLLRVVQVFRPENVALVQGMLVTMGLVSMVVSTFSIIATFNINRLIAYASINHAGVLAIGLGIGGSASYGLLLYAVSNAFIKVILFLTAGRVIALYRTRDTRQIAGLIRDLPYSGLFLMLGTFALLGFPPFGAFFGELLILSALVSTKHLLVFAAFCVLITATFVAMGRTIFPMIWGEAKEPRQWPQQTLLHALPKLAFLTALVALGVYIPPAVNALLQEVAISVGGS